MACRLRSHVYLWSSFYSNHPNSTVLCFWHWVSDIMHAYCVMTDHSLIIHRKQKPNLNPLTLFLTFSLDDTFIITGAYLRLNPNMDVQRRVRITMEEVAHSISLTTITTLFAFLLGLRSTLPGVNWMCLCKCKQRSDNNCSQ